MIQAFRGDFWVTTGRAGAFEKEAQPLTVCEGARFYQACGAAAILGPTGRAISTKKAD
jgi:hypothetical protein